MLPPLFALLTGSLDFIQPLLLIKVKVLVCGLRDLFCAGALVDLERSFRLAGPLLVKSGIEDDSQLVPTLCAILIDCDSTVDKLYQFIILLFIPYDVSKFILVDRGINLEFVMT